MRPLARLIAPAAALVFSAHATPLVAQGAAPAIVRVRVIDTTQAPLGGVTLVVIRAHEQGSLFGTTNDQGRYTFVFAPDSGSYRIIARKLGYVQTTRLLPVHAGDTLSFSLALARVPPQLDTVHVSARALSDDYFVSAQMIAAEGKRRYVKDAFDAMRDINPNMLGDDARGCRRVRNIWVDGRRYGFSPAPSYDMPIGELKDAPVFPSDAWEQLPDTGPLPAHVGPSNLLAMIHSAHVAAIAYRNCWDTSLPGWGGRNAIFVTLKDGYAFDPKRGSYPIDSVPER